LSLLSRNQRTENAAAEDRTKDLLPLKCVSVKEVTQTFVKWLSVKEVTRGQSIYCCCTMRTFALVELMFSAARNTLKH